MGAHEIAETGDMILECGGTGIVRRVLGIGAIVATAACGGDAEAGGAAADSTSEAGFSRVVNVEVAPVEAGAFTELIRLTGTVEANRDVQVSAEESGTITDIFVDKGSPVAAGQPIMKIDDRILSAQVAQARAQAELARETWERRKVLFEEDQVGSELAYLEARYGADQAAANLESLEQRLARTTIRAPIEGVLESRTVEVGTNVGPGAPVARIVDLNPAKVTAGVPERFSSDVEPGSQVTVDLDALEDETFEGRITYVGSTIDPGSRTFPVEFQLPNPRGVIKPEMVANVSLVRRVLEDVVVVPQEALVRVEDGFVAFVAREEEDGRLVAERRAVVLGPSQRNLVVVEAGLEEGDRLIVVGQGQVAAGDRVRIVGSAHEEGA